MRTILFAILVTTTAAVAQAQTPPAPTTAAPTTAAPTMPAPTTPVPTSPAPAAGSTTATPPPHPRHRVTLAQHFAAVNTTKDGHLTLEQAQAANWRYVTTHFSDIDTAKQGYITLGQLQAFMRGRRAARHTAKAPATSPTQN